MESARGLKCTFPSGWGKLYYEKLALEVGATVAGYEVMKPPVIMGASGVEQRFTFVAVEGSDRYAFDIYNDVGEVEILKTYVKKMDTGAETFVVCLSGRPKEQAKELSENYGIQILGPKEVGDFFTRRIAQLIGSRRLSAKITP
jgi:hypothetical protein